MFKHVTISHLFLLLHLINIEYENKKLYPQLMHLLFKHKETANAEFKNSNFDRALEHYIMAVDIGERLSKTNIDFYDIENLPPDINYEMAALKYNLTLIYYKQYSDANTILTCEEAFEWLGRVKVKGEKVDKLRNLLDNKYFISLLRIGQYKNIIQKTKGIQKCKELEIMLKRLKYDQFEIMFKEVSPLVTRDSLIIQKIMATTRVPNFQVEDVHFDKTMLRNIIFQFINGELLPEHLLISILKSGHNSLINQDNIQTIRSNKAYIFGDTHGQFLDTLAILSKIPGNSINREEGLVLDESSVFIFNGDFVDRGKDGIENFILLVLLKLVYPMQIFLNRGNHEFEAINIKFGFLNEIFMKYKTHFKTIFQAFVTTFTTLPLCSILNDKYFIVHGGLPRFTTLNHIRSINRYVNGTSDDIISCLMWSDPDEIEDWKPNNRGIAIAFGQKITERFLNENNLEKVIRSHEFIENGYKENHNGLVGTIFSAPNYCGGSNDASYIAIINGDYNVVKFSHWSKNNEFIEFIDLINNEDSKVFE